jgi:hypothetical protein
MPEREEADLLHRRILRSIGVEPLPIILLERAGAKIIEFPAASHTGGYTHYATPFAKLIEQAAAALAG